MILFSLFKNINIKVVQKLENYIYQSVPINEATPSAICKKKFASQIKRAIFVTLFAVIFFACILCITKFNFMQKKHKIR